MEDVQVAVSLPALPWCLDVLWHVVGFQCMPAVWLKERISENWKCSHFTDWKLETWQDMSIAHDSVAKIWPSSDSRSVQFSSVQSLSHVRLFATPWITARQASLSITTSRSSLRLTSIESVMPSSHLILCRTLLLPPIPPSIRIFSNELALPSGG